MGKNTVFLFPDQNYVIKRPLFNTGKLEVASTLSAINLARGSKLFSVPEIIEYDKDYKWIKFEFLSNLIPLSSMLRNSKDGKLGELLFKLGVILSYIHKNLDPECGKFLIPPSIDFPGRKSFLHGDFNLSNVQYDASRDCIVIIDWALTPLLGAGANWGACYWDIAWLMNAVFCSPPFLAVDYKFRKKLAENFMSGYELDSSIEINRAEFSSYSLRVYQLFLRKFIQRTDLPHFLVQFPNRYNFRAFARSLG